MIDKDLFEEIVKQTPDNEEFLFGKDRRTEGLRFLALALAGEAGELANVVKKDWRGSDIEYFSEEVLDELADIFIYACLLLKNVDNNVDLFQDFNMFEHRIKQKKALYFKKMKGEAA